MSVIDTKLNNLNIWEGTSAQVESAYEQELIGENDLVFITDETSESSFEDKFRYSDMPLASEQFAGKIVQFIGNTDTYVEGAFYKCVVVGSHLEISYVGEDLESVIIRNEEDCKSYYSVLHDIGGSVTFSWVPGSGWMNVARETIEPMIGWDVLPTGDKIEGDTVTIDNVAEYGWQLVKLPHDDVAFADITGNPRDNSALDEELDRIELINAIQVTELPEITEENYNKVYQYVGNDDPTNGVYKGSFYYASDVSWEYDPEHSANVENAEITVFDETRFLSKVREMLNAESVTSSTYFEIRITAITVGGWSAEWWIPEYESSEAWWTTTTQYMANTLGVLVSGSPVASSGSNGTVFRFNVSPLLNVSDKTWKTLNMYPTPYANSVSLYNVAKENTSIIEHLAGSLQTTARAPQSVIIGVSASSSSDRGHSTAVGYNTRANYMGTAFGSNANADSGGIAIGAQSKTYGEWGVCVGNGGSSASDRSAAVGVYCISEGQYSGCFGTHSKTQGAYSAALGYHAYTTGAASGAIQLGEGTNPTTNTLQFRNYTLVDANGIIPSSRLSAYSPEDGYVLTYDGNSGVATWASVLPDIPVTQEDYPMPQATEGRTVQYIGQSDGTYVEGYFYKATYDEDNDVYYWRQIDTQPSGGSISYNTLNDKPTINGVTVEGDMDLVEDLGLPRVAVTGSYADLTTKPGINGHPLLTNTPASTLEISYNDLVDKPANLLPNLPEDKDEYDYMLKWDHVQGKLVWYRATDAEEDLGTLPEPTNE